MRQMLEFMSNVGKQAAETLKQQMKNSGESVFEFKTLSKKITVDVNKKF